MSNKIAVPDISQLSTEFSSVLIRGKVKPVLKLDFKKIKQSVESKDAAQLKGPRIVFRIDRLFYHLFKINM